MSDTVPGLEDVSTRVMLIQKIIGHPEQLPTFDEIDYFLVSHSTESIRAQLGTMVDQEMIARVEGDNEVFYGLTEEYRSEIEQKELLRATDTLQEATLRTQRPREIDEKIKLERPDWPAAEPYTGEHPDVDVIVDE